MTAMGVVPYDPEAEASVLGAMMLSETARATAIEMVTAGDFYRPLHSELFVAMTSLFRRGEPCDVVTIANELRRGRSDLPEVDTAELIEMQINLPAVGAVGHYAAIVADLAALRRLAGVGSEIVEIARSAPGDVDGALDHAEELVHGVRTDRAENPFVDIGTVALGIYDRFDAIETGANVGDRVETGLLRLDAILGGLYRSNLIMVGARPAMGKTSFAIGVALHVALEEQQPVLFFSLEMSEEEVTDRAVSMLAGVPAKHIKDNTLGALERERVDRAIGRLAGAKWQFYREPSASILDVRARSRVADTRFGKAGLVVVDYLQLLSGSGQWGSNKVADVSEVSRGLKLLARELHVPVLALSQLSRNLELRNEKRPVLADLRESGSLEQDADVVIFIHRDHVYDPSADPGAAEAIVAKHRQGPLGTAALQWDGTRTRFSDADL